MNSISCLSTTIALKLLLLPPTYANEVNALLLRCLPANSTLNTKSDIKIEVSHKTGDIEKHHLIRYETPEQLLIKSHEPGLGNYYYLKHQPKPNIFREENGKLTPTDGNNLPAWLLSETLLVVDRGHGIEKKINTQNSLGGLNYYTVTISNSNENTLYPKQTFSFKESAEQQCDLTRSAFFVEDSKLRMKIYSQWQIVEGEKILNSLHIEDTKSLESVRYDIENLEIVEQFDDTLFPSMPVSNTAISTIPIPTTLGQ